MKKLAKVLSLMLAGTMVLSMAACGGSNSSKQESGGAENNTSSDAVFKIGGIGPTTGGAAQYGLGVKNAAEIAVDEINAAGGINGYKVEFKFEDDEHDPEKSVNAYNSLKDWGMQILMGTVTSGPSTAVSAEAVNDSIFMLTPSASSVDVIKDKPNVFQICFTDPNQGLASAQYIGQNLKDITKVAAIYDSSDVYSSGVYSTFKAEAANQPFEIVAEGAFTQDNKTDFSVQLQQAKDAGAELLFLPFYYQEISLVLTQADDMDYKPIIFGVDGMDGILGVENFNTSLAEGVYLLTPFVADATDDATVKFVTAYKEKCSDEVPNQFAADAYDAMYTLKAAIEKADLTPEDDISAICEGLVGAITEITVTGLTSDETGMTWNAEGEVSKAPKAMIIKNGAYTSVE